MYDHFDFDENLNFIKPRQEKGQIFWEKADAYFIFCIYCSKIDRTSVAFCFFASLLRSLLWSLLWSLLKELLPSLLMSLH